MRILSTVILLVGALAPTAAGDWVVMMDGREYEVLLYEIQPPLVLMTGRDGRRYSARLAQVDLEASRAKTDQMRARAARIAADAEISSPVEIEPSREDLAEEPLAPASGAVAPAHRPAPEQPTYPPVPEPQREPWTTEPQAEPEPQPQPETEPDQESEPWIPVAEAEPEPWPEPEAEAQAQPYAAPEDTSVSSSGAESPGAEEQALQEQPGLVDSVPIADSGAESEYAAEESINEKAEPGTGYTAQEDAELSGASIAAGSEPEPFDASPTEARETEVIPAVPEPAMEPNAVPEADALEAEEAAAEPVLAAEPAPESAPVETESKAMIAQNMPEPAAVSPVETGIGGAVESAPAESSTSESGPAAPSAPPIEAAPPGAELPQPPDDFDLYANEYQGGKYFVMSRIIDEPVLGANAFVRAQAAFDRRLTETVADPQLFQYLPDSYAGFKINIEYRLGESMGSTIEIATYVVAREDIQAHRDGMLSAAELFARAVIFVDGARLQ